MKKLTFNLNEPYDILIEKGSLAKTGELVKSVLNAKKLVLVSDTNVYPIYGQSVKSSLQEAGYEVFEYIYTAGEKSKNTGTIIDMVEFMARCGLTRQDFVVALGGGVCGDMAGFAAAIYLRGIKFVQIPTSLLAQVDSSVGGKTGVDLPQGKNLCGAFHQPSFVIIDSNTLLTLPKRYFSDGMAEVIKYGCIKSEPLFNKLLQFDAHDIIEDVIYECVDIKRCVVENDEKELGERALLNFGHTIGHAIEKLYNFQTISHGEAVGIGMLKITQLSQKLGITPLSTDDKIEQLLVKYNLPIDDKHTPSEIVNAMGADKKRTSDGIKFVMLNSIGDAFIKPIKYTEIPLIFGV